MTKVRCVVEFELDESLMGAAPDDIYDEIHDHLTEPGAEAAGIKKDTVRVVPFHVWLGEKYVEFDAREGAAIAKGVAP